MLSVHLVSRCLLFALLCMGGLGCSPRPDVAVKETANLRKVREAYTAAAAKLRRPPRGMTDLSPFLKERGDPEELLKSRSGDSIEIVWGLNPAGFSASAGYPNIIAYEKTPFRGTHYVATSMGIAPLSPEELSRQLAAQKP